MNLYELQQEFFKDLTEVCRCNGLCDIYVNSYIGSICQDHIQFIPAPKWTIKIDSDTTDPLVIGSVGKINIWIDFSRRYSDHRLTDKEGKVYHDFKEKYGHESLV